MQKKSRRDNMNRSAADERVIPLRVASTTGLGAGAPVDPRQKFKALLSAIVLSSAVIS